MNGKGSTSRPMSVSRDEFARRWDDTFAKWLSAPAESPQPEPELVCDCSNPHFDANGSHVTHGDA